MLYLRFWGIGLKELGSGWVRGRVSHVRVSFRVRNRVWERVRDRVRDKVSFV